MLRNMLISVLLIGAMLCCAACQNSEDIADGDVIDGDRPDGDQVTDGDRPDGDQVTDGDRPDGDQVTDGDRPDGDQVTDGDRPDGDQVTDGDVVADGDMTDGDRPDGDIIDGDEDETEADTPQTVRFAVVDTAQSTCYGNGPDPIACPAEGHDFYGQDGHYAVTPMNYALNEAQDIVIDRNTGLMWERAHHSTRVTYADALAACNALNLGGYDDWRMPSIKELFSLAHFMGSVGGEFFVESEYFDLEIPTEGELTGTHSYEMMGQTWSATPRPDGEPNNYFFNFLDGHIKSGVLANAELFYRCVRGDETAFENDFHDNGDQTISDLASGLMWQKENAEQSPGDYQFNWQEALAYCNDLVLGGHDDWRLPDVKELQSIVDYTRSDPALDTSVFTFNQPDGSAPYFWSSTTQLNYENWAAYVCFGPCSSETGHDIHGPGAQRADPKHYFGQDFPDGIGDQKDVVQFYNFVRCVR